MKQTEYNKLWRAWQSCFVYQFKYQELCDNPFSPPANKKACGKETLRYSSIKTSGISLVFVGVLVSRQLRVRKGPWPAISSGLLDFLQYSGTCPYPSYIQGSYCMLLKSPPPPPIQINHNKPLCSKYRVIILPNYALLGRGVNIFAKI
jgi:hypothetical protein